MGPERSAALLREHLEELKSRRAELERVRESLQGRDDTDQPFHYPSLVADWGLEYLDGERLIIEKLLLRLEEE